MTSKLGLYALLLIAAIGLAACATPNADKVLTTEFSEPAKLAEAPGSGRLQMLWARCGATLNPASRATCPWPRMTALDDLRQRAGRMGATHVVFQGYQGNRRPVALGMGLCLRIEEAGRFSGHRHQDRHCRKSRGQGGCLAKPDAMLS